MSSHVLDVVLVDSKLMFLKFWTDFQISAVCLYLVLNELLTVGRHTLIVVYCSYNIIQFYLSINISGMSVQILQCVSVEQHTVENGTLTFQFKIVKQLINIIVKVITFCQLKSRNVGHQTDHNQSWRRRSSGMLQPINW
jgi:hypothetical protein